MTNKNFIKILISIILTLSGFPLNAQQTFSLSNYFEDHPIVLSSISLKDKSDLTIIEDKIKNLIEHNEVNFPDIYSTNLTKDINQWATHPDSVLWGAYYSYVAFSIYMDWSNKLPWKLWDSSLDNLKNILSNSSSSGNAFYDYCNSLFCENKFNMYSTPTDPLFIYEFFNKYNIIGQSKGETIERLLQWCYKYTCHFLGGYTPDNYFLNYQYNGGPPISSIIQGTIYTGMPGMPLRRFQAGCWGSVMFYKNILKLINIPATLIPETTATGNHATIFFPTENRHIHGDGLYGQVDSTEYIRTHKPESLSVIDTVLVPNNQGIARIFKDTIKVYLTQPIKEITPVIFRSRNSSISLKANSKLDVSKTYNLSVESEDLSQKRTYRLIFILSTNVPSAPITIYPKKENVIGPFQNIDFKWTKSKNIDNNPVLYKIHIWNTTMDSTTQWIMDTTMNINGYKIRGKTKYYYNITAFNGLSENISNVDSFYLPNRPPTAPIIKMPENNKTFDLVKNDPIYISWIRSIDSDEDPLIYYIHVFDSVDGICLGNTNFDNFSVKNSGNIQRIGRHYLYITASDGELWTNSDTIIFYVINYKPVAFSMVPEISNCAGALIRLHADSDDPNGDPTSIKWCNVPPGINLDISNITRPFFIAPNLDRITQYVFTFVANDGVIDSDTCKITVTVSPVYRISKYISICQGQNYLGWTTTGTYYRTLQSKSGCDSIVTINLTINPVNITENKTICQGQNYLGWTTSGTYQRNLQSKSGCDSTVITNLTVNPVYKITENKAICQGQNYQGCTTSGTYQRKLQSKTGCDSIVTTNLTVNPVYNITENKTICQGQNYQGWTTSGTYQRKLQSETGCDSIVTTNLTVNPVYNITENKTICQGQNYLGWTTSGTFQRKQQSKTGCDSTVTTNLTVNPVYNITENKAICQGQKYQGWTTSGNYQRKLQSKSGCDSIVTTNLTVNPVYNISENKVICQGQNYKGWTTTGKYALTLKSKSGCDSIITTFLKVNPLYNIKENIYICQGVSYNGWTTSGTFNRTLQSISGCDSIVSTDLTVFPSYNPIIIVHGDTLQAIRQYKSYQWYNESGVIAGATTEKYVISKSGKYRMVITDENGCTNTSEVFNAVYSYVKVSKFEDFKYSIIPNPNKGQFVFRIDSGTKKDLMLKLLNPLGQVLETRSVKSAGINHSVEFNVAYLDIPVKLTPCSGDIDPLPGHNSKNTDD